MTDPASRPGWIHRIEDLAALLEECSQEDALAAIHADDPLDLSERSLVYMADKGYLLDRRSLTLCAMETVVERGPAALDMGLLDMGLLDIGPLDIGLLDIGPLDIGPLDIGPRGSEPDGYLGGYLDRYLVQAIHDSARMLMRQEERLAEEGALVDEPYEPRYRALQARLAVEPHLLRRAAVTFNSLPEPGRHVLWHCWLMGKSFAEYEREFDTGARRADGLFNRALVQMVRALEEDRPT
jgi:hypothetical protein